MADSEKISPTAYATGQFWIRHGLSPASLGTGQGRRLDRGFRLLMDLVRRVSGVSLEAMMLARHRGIDARLKAAIDQGRIGQVIEIAAGLSGRGARFAQHYGHRLQYLETDLPKMAAKKQQLLDSAGLLSARHRVLELDALAETGPASLAAAAGALDPAVGTAIITEGLMNYLSPADAQAVWRRIAEVLGRFPQGLYLCDVYPGRANGGAAMSAFGKLIQLFVRGRMHVHFDSAEQVVAVMHSAGFATAAIHRTADMAETQPLAAISGADRVSVLEAATG
jgi:O-methyltransferase involved in polyketide biosynthesis